MNTIKSTPIINKCNDCGSDLILIDVTTYKVDNNPSLVTKSRYRCSNTACQEEADKRIAKRIQLKKEQELARENRKKNFKSIVLKTS